MGWDVFVLHHGRHQQGDGYEPTLLCPGAVRPDALGSGLSQNVCVYGLSELDVEFVVLCGSVVHQHNQFGAYSLDFFLLHQYWVLGVVPLALKLVEPLLCLVPGLACNNLSLGALTVVVPPVVSGGTANGGFPGGVALETCGKKQRRGE